MDYIVQGMQELEKELGRYGQRRYWTPIDKSGWAPRDKLGLLSTVSMVRSAAINIGKDDLFERITLIALPDGGELDDSFDVSAHYREITKDEYGFIHVTDSDRQFVEQQVAQGDTNFFLAGHAEQGQVYMTVAGKQLTQKELDYLVGQELRYLVGDVQELEDADILRDLYLPEAQEALALRRAEVDVDSIGYEPLRVAFTQAFERLEARIQKCVSEEPVQDLVDSLGTASITPAVEISSDELPDASIYSQARSLTPILEPQTLADAMKELSTALEPYAKRTWMGIGGEESAEDARVSHPLQGVRTRLPFQISSLVACKGDEPEDYLLTPDHSILLESRLDDHHVKVIDLGDPRVGEFFQQRPVGYDNIRVVATVPGGRHYFFTLAGEPTDAEKESVVTHALTPFFEEFVTKVPEHSTWTPAELEEGLRNARREVSENISHLGLWEAFTSTFDTIEQRIIQYNASQIHARETVTDISTVAVSHPPRRPRRRHSRPADDVYYSNRNSFLENEPYGAACAIILSAALVFSGIVYLLSEFNRAFVEPAVQEKRDDLEYKKKQKFKRLKPHERRKALEKWEEYQLPD